MTAGAHRSVTVMLPTSLIAALDEASRARDVGRRWLIERLLTDSLERLIPVEELRLTRDARAVPVEAGERPQTASEVVIPVHKESCWIWDDDEEVHGIEENRYRTLCGTPLDTDGHRCAGPVTCAACARRAPLNRHTHHVV